MMHRFIALAVVVFLTGCSATGPVFEARSAAPAGYGIVYVYRPSTFVNGGLAPYVYVDRAQKPKLRNGGYQRYELSAGVHKIATDGNFLEWHPGRAEVSVNLRENDVKYLRLGSDVGFVSLIPAAAVTTAKLSQVPQSIGEVEIRETSESQ